MTKPTKRTACTVADARDYASTAGTQAIAAARYVLRDDLDAARVHIRHMVLCVDAIATAIPTPVGPVDRWECEGNDDARRGEPLRTRLTAVLMGITEFLFGCADGLEAGNLRMAANNFRFVYAQHLQALQLLEARTA